ncbi:MAG: hypothetical protein K2O67_03790, partial [Clostridia bacterium]|nr:hypothetical protein [Clostridia bacterium]
MRNKSVAVLDIRSGEITAAIAEKGVNNTFIIKNKYTRSYDGYAEGALLDTDDFSKAVRSALNSVVSSADSSVKRLYVSIPCEFVETQATDNVISFHSAQRVSINQLRAVTENSVPDVSENETVIKCGALYYVLSDKRRMLNPVGMTSDSLRARLSFFICKSAIMDLIVRAASPFRTIKQFEWFPQNYAEGLYLFEPEQRDGYSLLLDFGYISSAFSVVCGNGIAFSEAFSVGVGHLALLVSDALNIPFGAATELIGQVNLNAKDREDAVEEIFFEGKPYKFPAAEVRDLIREGLDGICEMIETCLQSFTAKDLTGAPIY